MEALSQANASPVTITSTRATQSIAGFSTTGNVSMTKTGGTATFTGNVNGNGLTINGNGGTLNLGTGLDTYIYRHMDKFKRHLKWGFKLTEYWQQWYIYREGPSFPVQEQLITMQPGLKQ